MIVVEERFVTVDRGKSKQEEFVRLLLTNERRIRAYVRVLVLDRDVAEDVFQEVSVTLLDKYDSLAADADFTAWACRVASFKVMELRQKQRRDRLVFSDDAMRLLEEEATRATEHASDRGDALRRCVGRLSERNRQLLAWRYDSHVSIDDIARRLGRSVQAVYKALSRIRHSLHDCVSKALAEDGSG